MTIRYRPPAPKQATVRVVAMVAPRKAVGLHHRQVDELYLIYIYRRNNCKNDNIPKQETLISPKYSNVNPLETIPKLTFGLVALTLLSSCSSPGRSSRFVKAKRRPTVYVSPSGLCCLCDE